jgi:hypothetical protein
MPVEVIINGKPDRVEMKDGRARIEYVGKRPSIDPDGWILMAR